MSAHLLDSWVLALGALLGGALLGYLARVFGVRRLAAAFARTPTDLDDRILASARRHIPLWFLLGGAAIAARLAPIPAPLSEIAGRGCAVVFILSLAVVAANLGTDLLRRRSRSEGITHPVTSLSVNILRGTILALAGLLILSNLGLSITPLLTALGIGSLAVALALQPTLTNLIAGIHIALARPIRVGDFVQLETGVKGEVEDIGWRATRIRELPNNIIIVPNSRLAEMIVTNFELPAPEQAALAEVGVAYGSDMLTVERVTCEVARETLKEVQGGVTEFEPFIRYHTFGDFSINFTVILRIRQFTDRYLVLHEFMKRLKIRFDREGIEIPFPQRVVHTPASGVDRARREVTPATGSGRGR